MHLCDVGQLVEVVAEHAHDGRDAAARGEEEHLRRGGVRQGEVPCGLVEHDEGAGASGPHQVVRDLAVGDGLGCDRDAVRRDAGRRRAVGAVGQAVRPPVTHAVDVDADPDVLPGHVPEPAAPGPEDDRHGIRGLGADVDDARAQVGARAQRVEQVEVVLGDERSGEGLGHPAAAAQEPPDRAGCRRRAQAGARHPGCRGRSVDGGCAHIPQRNLRDRNLRKRNHRVSQARRTVTPNGRP